MQSIDLIHDNLRKSADRVLERVEEMREHCMAFPTPRGGCHTLWVLGHLAYIEALVIRDFMLAEPNPLAEWKELFDANEDAVRALLEIVAYEVDGFPALQRR